MSDSDLGGSLSLSPLDPCLPLVHICSSPGARYFIVVLWVVPEKEWDLLLQNNSVNILICGIVMATKEKNIYKPAHPFSKWNRKSEQTNSSLTKLVSMVQVKIRRHIYHDLAESSYNLMERSIIYILDWVLIICVDWLSCGYVITWFDYLEKKYENPWWHRHVRSTNVWTRLYEKRRDQTSFHFGISLSL